MTSCFILFHPHCCPMSLILIDRVPSPMRFDPNSEFSYYYADCNKQDTKNVIVSGTDIAGTIFSSPLPLQLSSSMTAPYLFSTDWLALCHVNASSMSSVCVRLN